MEHLNQVERITVDLFLKESKQKLQWRIQCVKASKGALGTARLVDLINLAIQLKAEPA